MSVRYRLTIAYDGSAYAGWQVQPDYRTIQGEIESVISQISRQKKVRVESSGRTDTGVHARAQVAHFDLCDPMPTARLLEGINALLDKDIRILNVQKASSDFHARFSCVEKEYRYRIWNGSVLPPFIRHERLHIRRPLDVAAMREAANVLEGEHDFASFKGRSKGDKKGTVRFLHELKVSKIGNEITITARANGFLYKMVRSLAGYLIQVGSGKMSTDTAQAILDLKKRTADVKTAAPQGLILWKVYY